MLKEALRPSTSLLYWLQEEVVLHRTPIGIKSLSVLSGKQRGTDTVFPETVTTVPTNSELNSLAGAWLAIGRHEERLSRPAFSERLNRAGMEGEEMTPEGIEPSTY